MASLRSEISARKIKKQKVSDRQRKAAYKAWDTIRKKKEAKK